MLHAKPGSDPSYFLYYRKLGSDPAFPNEIDRMPGADGRPRIDRQLLADKAKKLDKTINKLVAMRTGLRHATVCSAPSHME